MAISSAFPIAAALLPRPGPRWMGWVDVSMAGLVVAVGLAIVARAGSALSERASQQSVRIYRGMAALFLLLLIGFFVVGERINWSILLPGLAWRAWLAAWILPAAVSLWYGSAGPAASRRTADRNEES